MAAGERRRRLRRVVGRLMRGIDVIREDARHPSEGPDPHPVGAPVVLEPEDRRPPPVAERGHESAPSRVAKGSSDDSLRGRGEVPWYLDNEEEVDGWDHSNARSEED